MCSQFKSKALDFHLFKMFDPLVSALKLLISGCVCILELKGRS